MPTRIANCRYDDYDVYIGRGSKWGNSYSHLDRSKAPYHVDTREEAIELYRRWILSIPGIMNVINTELKDRVLGCYCRPPSGFRGELLCHGQILAGLADGIDPRVVK